MLSQGLGGDGDGFGSVLSREVFICALDPSPASPPEGRGGVGGTRTTRINSLLSALTRSVLDPTASDGPRSLGKKGWTDGAGISDLRIH